MAIFCISVHFLSLPLTHTETLAAGRAGWSSRANREVRKHCKDCCILPARTSPLFSPLLLTSPETLGSVAALSVLVLCLANCTRGFLETEIICRPVCSTQRRWWFVPGCYLRKLHFFTVHKYHQETGLTISWQIPQRLSRCCCSDTGTARLWPMRL